MDNRLTVTELKKSFPTPTEPLIVLDGVDLDLGPGDAAAITGASGCGKSTLLHILGTLDTPTSGRVLLGGRNPFELREADLAAYRNQRLGFVFQDHHLLPQCSVLENVLIPTLVSRSASNDAEERARDLIERVGLSDRLDHRPAELSGGERQRVAIARALVQDPYLVLCDEPTGNLDPHSARSVGDLFLELHRDRKNILVVVTHSMELAGRFPRQYELAAGQLKAAPSTPEPPHTGQEA